jgi:hypothetical protein
MFSCYFELNVVPVDILDIFVVKDRVDSEGIDIVYCPTEQMLTDFFTKPLQGSLFRLCTQSHSHGTCTYQSVHYWKLHRPQSRSVLEVKISERLSDTDKLRMGLMQM